MQLDKGTRIYNGPWIEIPDCSRDDLPQFFIERGYTQGAEVGVYKGEFTEKLLNAGLRVYAIDPWQEYLDYGVRYYHDFKQNRQDKMYEDTCKLLNKHRGCTIIRKTSVEAAQLFDDNTLDFVYIDANHGLKYIVEDMWIWMPKIKKGGAMAGHDYAYTRDSKNQYSYHVRYGVDAYVGAFGIKDLYILGRKNPRPGEKRDKWRSWMIIK